MSSATGHTCSINVLPPELRRQLSEIAFRSIEHGVEHQCALPVVPSEWPPALREVRTSFVTLQIGGELRGCIGSLVPRYPLVRDVADHAYAAAFRDPRFSPVCEAELARLEVHLSVLTRPLPIAFDDENDLIDKIVPGVDGLVLKKGRHQGTFLPAVWEKISTPQDFLTQLKIKAGLRPDYWSDDIVVEKYTTESW